MLAFLAGLPFIGYIVSMLLAAGAIWVSGNILHTVTFTLTHLALMAAGFYIVAKSLTKEKLDDRALGVAVLGVIFVIAGVYLLPSMGYSIVP